MKLAIISDLHREFWTPVIPKYSCNAVVFAGDIASPIEKTMDFLTSYSNKLKKPVIAVLGNHDFYGSNIDKALEYAKSRTSESEYLYLLENQSYCMNGIKFIGCTLWTDFSFDTGGNVSLQEENAYISQADISDFFSIKYGNENKIFSAMKCINLFRESIEYLENEIKKTKKERIVVITHFGIDKKCSQPKHRTNRLQAYFIANVSSILKRYTIDTWIYGHTHYSNSFSAHSVKVVSNQLGYPEDAKEVRTNVEYYIDV